MYATWPYLTVYCYSAKPGMPNSLRDIADT